MSKERAESMCVHVCASKAKEGYIWRVASWLLADNSFDHKSVFEVTNTMTVSSLTSTDT